MSMRLLTAATWVAATVSGQVQPLSCPTLTCNSDGTQRKVLDADLCFEVGELEQPIKNLKSYKCSDYENAQTVGKNIRAHLEEDPSSYVIFSKIQGARVCELDIQSGEFAWFEEATQVTKTPEVPQNSQLKNKKTQAFCRSTKSLEKGINNGRPCENDWQCVTQNCVYDADQKKKLCKGLKYGEKCSAHSDCEATLFCQRSLYWPWQNECAPYKKTGDSCREDYDCAPKDYCWFASEFDK